VRVVVIDLGRDYRGGQHQAFLLSQGLLARGHQPEMVVLHGSLLASRAQDAGIRVHLIAGRLRRPGAALVIRGLLQERRTDIVHANEPHALTAAWLARAHRRVPLVAARRVIFPLSRGAISLARYRASAGIVAVSQCVADAVIASGLSPERLIVIHDGVPIAPACSMAERDAARRRLGIAQDIPLLGCVSVFTPDKGQDLLIRALPMVRASFPKCQLLLAGTGPCDTELHALVAEFGLDGAIHFAGFVEDLSTIYAAIDLFAFPAHAEALGSALLSAMACGLPVVAAARGGIPEAVENGRNGLLLEDLNPEMLAGAITRLLSNSEEASRLGAAARETVSARFSVDHMVDATLGLYERLTKDM
jgi:glycosyltransferase involved in cell wall biosynthesis